MSFSNDTIHSQNPLNQKENLATASATIQVTADANLVQQSENSNIRILSDGGEAQGFSHKTHGTECISNHKYANIEARVALNREQILSESGNNLMKQNLFKVADTYFDWPMQTAAGHDQPGYHFVSAYVDHDINPNSVADFACSDLTYDSGAYNHQGTDYAAYPFGWHAMDNDLIEVIAAAPGTIVYKEDGNYDENCVPNTESANIVIIEHPGGTQSWYAHLKNGSVTSKNVGDAVVVGEYLGIVGSSGNSTGPHLHFEVRNSEGAYIDPYFAMSGSNCNTTTNETWWNNQHSHNDSAINGTFIHSAPPVYGTCNDRAEINEVDFAEVGNDIYLGLFLRHATNGETYTVNLYRPNGTLQYTYNLTSPVSFISNSFWYFTINLSPNSQIGEWTYEAYSTLDPTPVVRTLQVVPVGATGGSANVPTLSSWMLIMLALISLNLGLIFIRKENPIMPSVSL